MTSGQSFVSLEFLPLASGRPDLLGVMTLNRPDTFNAFNDQMIQQITEHAAAVGKKSDVRVLIIRAKGKHFCAGADLAWMQAAAGLSYEQNVEDALKLQRMFEALDEVPVPVIVTTHGMAMGGAVGLAAIGDVVIATEDARFCLSEVKLGLLPAVILPYVARRMHAGAFRRYGLTARVFGAAQARDAGLVDVVVSENTLQQTLHEELQHICAASPDAQAQLKQLYRTTRQNGLAQSYSTAEAIAMARTSPYGQAGLKSFFAKSDAPWKLQLSDGWRLP